MPRRHLYLVHSRSCVHLPALQLGWEVREEGVTRCIDCYLGLNSGEPDDESDDEEDEEDGDDDEEIDLEEEESKPPAKRAKRA